MNKTGIIALVALVTLFYQTDAWLLRRGWNAKNCFCKIVDNSNYNTVLHDFGSIQSCRGALGCGCGNNAMVTCGTSCDAKVKEWTSKNCPAHLKGKTVRAKYSASVCNNGIGSQSYKCGSDMCMCPCQG